MKKSLLFATLGLMTIYACSKEEKDTSPAETDPYYIKVAIDGESMETRGDNGVICQNNYGVCFSTGSVFDNDEKGLRINNDQFGGFSIDGLIAREGDTFTFDDSRSLYADLEWSLNGELYSTKNTDSTTNAQSFLYLQEVTRTDSVEGWGEAALIRGTFNCSISNDSKSDTKAVTGGSFYVRVFESI